VKRVVTESDKS